VRRPRRIPGRISAKLIPHDARRDALECTGCTLVWLRRCHADFVPSTAAAAAGRARSHTCKRPLYLRSKREGSFPYRHPPSLPIPVPFASPPDSSTSPPSTARRAFPSFPQFFFSPRFPPPAPSLSLSLARVSLVGPLRSLLLTLPFFPDTSLSTRLTPLPVAYLESSITCT